MSETPHPTPGILRTKLHRPPVGSDLVHRDRLLELIGEGSATPLTVVSAPAGYGKSVLVSQWMEALDHPCAWLSLDENDSELKGFLRYLLAAIETVIPGACPFTAGLMAAPELPPAPVVADHLTNELDTLGTPFFIALDDYHRIARSSPVHDFMVRLLEYPPPGVHLVVITRRAPPLPLIRLRADNRVTEVRLRDLRFSGPETADFLSRVVGLSVSETVLENLWTEVEGWAVGLRLLTLVLRHVEEPEDFLKKLRGGLPQTQSYLLREVLAGLEPGVRDSMLRASLLDRFCPEVLNAVCGADDSSQAGELSGQALVDTLQQDNLFTIRLDAYGEWFRYHHLFQELLKRELRKTTPDEEIARLHSRASAWFESQGLITEAIEHALASGDKVEAAGIVERHRKEELDEDRWHVVERWLDLLPIAVKSTRPSLLLGEAWSVYERWQLEKIPPILDRVEPLLRTAEEERELRGEVFFFQGALKYWAGNGQGALEDLKEARARLPEARKLVRGLLEFYVGLANSMIGKKDLAVQELNARILESGSEEGVYLSRLIGGLLFLNIMSADLVEGRMEAERFHALARDSQIPYTEAWGRYMEGCTGLHGLDMAQAVLHFTASSQHRYILHTRAALDGMAGLALAYQMRGETEEAEKAAEKLEAFAQELREPVHLAVAQACRVRIALLRGDQVEEVKWPQAGNGVPASSELFLWSEVPVITRARALVAAGSEEGLREASELLQEVRKVSEACRYTCHTIDVLVLQALAQEGLGQTDEALGILGDALALARPGHWIRPFVEPGQAIGNLLQRLEGPEGNTEFVRRILEVLDRGVPSGTPPSEDPDSLVDGLPSPASPRTIDTLTNRELEVLQLLAQRLSDKEIASRLFVSTNTVAHHLKGTYRKLGVNNRRQAVSRAVELGVIENA